MSLIRMYFPKECGNHALLLNLSFSVPSIRLFSFSSVYEICLPEVIIMGQGNIAGGRGILKIKSPLIILISLIQVSQDSRPQPWKV